MVPGSQRQKGRNGDSSMLNMAIEDLKVAKEKSSIAPAKVVFGSAGDLLPAIRDSMIEREDCVKLGLACADVCRALDRGLDGRKADQLNRAVLEAIDQLTTTVAQIQRGIVKLGKRNAISRFFHAKNDKDTIAGWHSDLDRILQVFKTELVVHTDVTVTETRHDVAYTREVVSDIQRAVVKVQEGIDVMNQTTPASIPGESPPPPPRACYGRDELIEKIVGLVETLTPVALIGGGGIGKTSVALTVLHDDRIKKRFGENRRFIRCDQFQPAVANFLDQLSKSIGAGVENPKGLSPLRPFLSSKEMFIALDNAESILDPQGSDAQEIYAVVEELTQMSNISLCITSRITTIPSDCKRLDVPTLSMEASRRAFYRIYDNSEQPSDIDNLLEQLDYHPLSVILLATVAHQNNWDNSRLSREWEERQTSVLKTGHKKSLAATIELSLTSPMFKELGHNARELLGVVAFFPQGVNENNLDWLFPTITNRRDIIDVFCILSLTTRSNGFITMLAPLRDYLAPRDPRSSPLLCTTKDHYSAQLRLWGDLQPDKPGFKESQWITSEGTNVEHLLIIFTSLDTDLADIWNTCADFIMHLYWHKPRFTALRSKIEGLSDDHRSKPECLFRLSQLLGVLGNSPDRKWLLIRTLELERGQGNNDRVARTLMFLADANRTLGLHEEGIQRSKEALEIYEQLGDAEGQAKCWDSLAWSLLGDNQLDAAEEAASHAIELFLDKGREFRVCDSYRLLGEIYKSKGRREKAIQHFNSALGIASSFDWHNQQFWIHITLSWLFLNEDEFDNAQSHIEQAKSHAVNDVYCLGRAMDTQARIWCQQGRLEEAKAEVLRALETFEKLGAASDVERCRNLLQNIELAMEDSSTSRESDTGPDGTPSSTSTSTENASG